MFFQNDAEYIFFFSPALDSPLLNLWYNFHFDFDIRNKK